MIASSNSHICFFCTSNAIENIDVEIKEALTVTIRLFVRGGDTFGQGGRRIKNRQDSNN